MKTKRIVAIILGVLLMGSMMTSACAAGAEPGIMPMFDYTHMITAMFELSGDVATIGGLIDPAGGYRTSVIVRLQYKSGNSWISIKILSDSNTSGTSSASGTHTLVEEDRGKDYRVHVTGRVFGEDGTVLEKLDKYSPIKHY